MDATSSIPPVDTLFLLALAACTANLALPVALYVVFRFGNVGGLPVELARERQIMEERRLRIEEENHALNLEIRKAGFEEMRGTKAETAALRKIVGNPRSPLKGPLEAFGLVNPEQ